MGKCIALNAYITRDKRSEVYVFSFYLKKLGGVNQTQNKQTKGNNKIQRGNQRDRKQKNSRENETKAGSQ